MVRSEGWLPLVIIISSYVLLGQGTYYPDEQGEKGSNEEEDEEEKTYLTVSVGEYVILNCDVDFPQSIEIPYVVNWKKDGETIFTRGSTFSYTTNEYSERISLLPNPLANLGRASINLTSIRETDGGWYQCMIMFPNRTPTTRNNGTWIHLTINGGNLITDPPINQTVREGEKAQLSCVAKETGTTVAWYKNKIPLKEFPELLHRSFIAENGSLTIRRTAMEDTGEYECEARNEVNERQSARAYVNVQHKARVVYAPKHEYLPFGRSGSLHCHYRANPPVTALRWDKDGYLFDPYNVPGVFSSENGSLYFSKVEDSHAGTYTCTPYNDLGTEGPSSAIEVVVLRPPMFMLTPINIYLKRLGETVEMPCDARDGENGHRPIIVWTKKDGSSLPEGRYMIKEGNLTIINIKEEDRGVYQCSATNKAATITTETELLVENAQPRAPYNLTAKASTKAVHLKWVIGRRRPKIKYSVWYKPTNAQEWKKHEVTGPKTSEATIKNLIPDCEYELMVSSEDPEGDSIFSKPLKIWTLRENGQDSELKPAPPNTIGSPHSLKMHLIEDGYLLTWDPPTFGVDNLRSYLVRWYQGASEFLISTAETTETSFLVNDLEEGHLYQFEVLAVTYNNDQSPSERITVKIPPYGKIKAISVSLTVIIIFVIFVSIAMYYGKNKFCPNVMKSKKYQENRV